MSQVHNNHRKQGGQGGFQSTPLNTLVGMTEAGRLLREGGLNPLPPTNTALTVRSGIDVNVMSAPSW